MQSKENATLKRNFLSAQVDLSKFSNLDFDKATDEEKKQQDVMGESTTFFKDGMKRLRKNPLAMGSIIVLAFIIIAILVLPSIVPYTYDQMMMIDGVRDRGATNLAPMEYSKAELQKIAAGEDVFPHLFGTDSLGRDYFIRVVYGTRVSLSVGIVAAIMVLIIGLIYGAIAGYFGGLVDLIMMRIVDIIYSLPDMLLIILLSVVLGDTLKPLIPVCYTENPILNILLTDKEAIMKEKGICVDINVGNVNLDFIVPIDVTTIFGNLLDNAIEAAETVEGNRYIYIRISSYQKMIVVRIENNCNDVKWRNDFPVSKKGKGRGIGLLNVKSSIEKYDGTLTLRQEENKFIVELFINP